MNSCLYEMKVAHHRRVPKQHTLRSNMFMFCLDLDEIDDAARHIMLFSHNRFNVYNFCEKDHIHEQGQTLKATVLKYVRLQDPNIDVKRIMLLTSVRVFGYVFNPVSFYYCFDRHEEPQCVVAEIGNTFGEKKCFFLGSSKKTKERFWDQQTKYFYISPFTDLEDSLEFRIGVPSEKIFIGVNTVKKSEKILFATLDGKKRELNNATLWKYSFLYPLVTWKVIILIHWHALLLYLKKIPFRRKEDNPDLQKEIHCAWARK